MLTNLPPSLILLALPPLIYALFRLLQGHLSTKSSSSPSSTVTATTSTSTSTTTSHPLPAPIPPHPPILLGLDYFTTLIRASFSYTLLPSISAFFTHTHSLTFREPPILLNLFSSGALVTADPENIKTILATRFEDYAVEPGRKAIENLLGRGIFTSDGERWRGGRGRVRGWFGRAGDKREGRGEIGVHGRGGGGGLEGLDLYDLQGRSEEGVKTLMRRVRESWGEGRTVDLSPLIFRMLMQIAGPMVLGCEGEASTDVLAAAAPTPPGASKSPADAYTSKRTWHKLGGWGYDVSSDVPNSRDITLPEFEDAFDRCCIWFSQGGDIHIAGIPLPNEQYHRDSRLVREFVGLYAADAIAGREGSAGGEKAAVDGSGTPAASHTGGGAAAAATKTTKPTGGKGGKRLGALVDHLAAADPPLPFELLRDEALHILFAARDTTAGTLCDLFWLLARNQRVLERLRGEVMARFPVGDEAGVPGEGEEGKEITFSAVKQLPYLSATIKETLRLHPVLPMNGKTAVRDTLLPRGGGVGGEAPVVVRKGTQVAWVTWMAHRDQGVFGSDVQGMRPERWLDGQDDGEWLEDEHQEGSEEEDEGREKRGLKKGIRPGWAYIPFNGGPRTCIGQQFALGTLSYVVIRVIQELEKEGLKMVSRDDRPWMEKFAVTAKNLHGCLVGFEER